MSISGSISLLPTGHKKKARLLLLFSCLVKMQFFETGNLVAVRDILSRDPSTAQKKDQVPRGNKKGKKTLAFFQL